MQHALEISRQVDITREQETGVVRDGKFGPATQSHYDPSRWAMTVTAPTNVHETREIVPDVDASQRRHEEGQPRFLKQLLSGDYLPSLLTIAHSIPAAREAMLLRSHLQPSYGQDPEWWKGHAIKLPRIVSTDTGAVVDPTAAQDDDITTELQRLMAFLDASDRSYACIDNLVSIAVERARLEGGNAETAMDKVLTGWESAAQRTLGDGSTGASLFHSVVGSNRPNSRQSQDLWSLPLTITEDDKRRAGDLTLNNIMDNALWSSDVNEEDVYDTFMDHCADVLPMRVTQDSKTTGNLGLIIPAHFYVDKYLKDNIASSRGVRKEMASTRKRSADIETLHQSIAGIPHPSGSGFIDAAELLKLAHQLVSGSSRDAVLADFEARGVELPKGALDVDEAAAAKNAEVAARLEDLSEKISNKLAALEQERRKTNEALSKLSQSSPQDLEESSLKHGYTLRGVSTKPSVTYVLRRKPGKVGFENSSDLMDLGSDGLRPPREVDEDLLADPDAPPGWMWWRIEYDPTHAPGRIMTVESTQDDVLRAVELEHSSALLVYASDRIMEHEEDASLPEPLAEFVQNDNKLFQQETEQQWSRDTAPRQGWGDTFGGVSSHSRRSSQGSTMVNYDLADHIEDGTMDDAPPYSFEDPYQGQGSGYPDASAWDRLTPEAHEIHLEDTDNKGEDLMTFEKDDAPAPDPATNRHSVAMSGLDGEGKPADR